MRNAFLAVFGALLLLPSILWAQSVTGQNGRTKTQIQALVSNVIRPASQNLPAIVRSTIRATKIVVVPGGPFPGPFAAIDATGNRVVVIQDLFAEQLYYYVEAYLFSKDIDRRHFPEWWMSYVLWRGITPKLSDGTRFYEGSVPKLPLEFAGIGDAQADTIRAEFAQVQEGLFVAALLDILFHELGHHVAGLYDPNSTSSIEMRKSETEADRFATDAFYHFSKTAGGGALKDQYNVLGRLISIGFLEQLQRFSKLAEIDNSRTHPSLSSRLSAAKDAGCNSTQDSRALTLMCDELRAAAVHLDDSDALLAEYKRRADGGEAFAQFKLGLILLGQGRFDDACPLFDKVFGKTDRRAAQYLGWCLEYAHLGKNMSEESRMRSAHRAYQIAAEAGWADSRFGFERTKN